MNDRTVAPATLPATTPTVETTAPATTQPAPTTEPAPTSTTLRPAAARSPLVVTGPVRYDDADGAFHGGMTWQQQVRHDEFNLFFDVAVQFTISPDPYSWDGLDYLVTGSVLVDAESVSCISTFFDHECGIVDLTGLP